MEIIGIKEALKLSHLLEALLFFLRQLFFHVMVFAYLFAMHVLWKPARKVLGREGTLASTVKITVFYVICQVLAMKMKYYIFTFKK
jgi:hypothetical protein